MRAPTHGWGVGAALLSGLILLAEPSPAYAQVQASLPDWAQESEEVARRALVIGVGAYEHLEPLAAPPKDAEVIAEKLGRIGFKVTHLSSQSSRTAILTAFDAFIAQVSEGDIALVYYSGHGFEREGHNYLVGADTPRQFDPARVDFVAIPLAHLMDGLRRSGSSIGMVLLDACRDDPFPQGAGSATPVQRKGLAPVRSLSTGLFLGFAAEPGQASFGGLSTDSSGMPSLFSRHLAAFLGQEGRSLFWTWREAGAKVYRDSGERQLPWFNADALFPEFKPLPSRADKTEMETAWRSAVVSTNPIALQAELEEFVRHFPDSLYTRAARKKIAELRREAVANLFDANRAALAEFQTSLALQTRALAGSVTSKSISSELADLNKVSTTAAATIFSEPRAESKVLATVPEATRLAALSLPDPEGWMTVRLPSGEIGYLGAVNLLRSSNLNPTATVRFAEGKDKVLSGALRTVAEQASRSPRTVVSVEISAASHELPDRARTLSYLRGLAVRSELQREGITSEQIKVTLLSRNPDTRDVALVRLLQ
jgi:hypothetical protein